MKNKRVKERGTHEVETMEYLFLTFESRKMSARKGERANETKIWILNTNIRKMNLQCKIL